MLYIDGLVQQLHSVAFSDGAMYSIATYSYGRVFGSRKLELPPCDFAV